MFQCLFQDEEKDDFLMKSSLFKNKSNFGIEVMIVFFME